MDDSWGRGAAILALLGGVLVFLALALNAGFVSSAMVGSLTPSDLTVLAVVAWAFAAVLGSWSRY